MSSADEFYIGYLPESPPGLAAKTRGTVWTVLLVALAVGGIIAIAQDPLPKATFEFGVEREFTGTIAERPFARLRVERPGAPDDVSSFLLVTFGKHGAADAVAGLDGKRVKLKGTLVYRGGETMVELADGAIEELTNGPAPASSIESLGEHTLVGEIVDSKCHLGVMNPSVDKVHRACATLCIRGGIPPILVARDESGAVQKLFLTARDGSAVNQKVLPMVADTVEITGEVVRMDDLLVLKADPETYVRVSD